MNAMKKDLLSVKIYGTREEMGRAAAADIRDRLLSLLSEKEQINAVFAAAPSQNEVLAALATDASVPWARINAFHMDEYVGVPKDAEQTFGCFLRTHLFDLVPFRSVHYIDASAIDPVAECARYAELLRTHPIDVVIMGIGENGHVAFNDPPVADFSDPMAVKPVELDPVCRQQQVNDGCFASLDEVPRTALTLTVPTLLSGESLFVIVPAASKARAVRSTLRDEISTACPATALRRHPRAVLYLDKDSSALL